MSKLIESSSPEEPGDRRGNEHRPVAPPETTAILDQLQALFEQKERMVFLLKHEVDRLELTFMNIFAELGVNFHRVSAKEFDGLNSAGINKLYYTGIEYLLVKDYPEGKIAIYMPEYQRFLEHFEIGQIPKEILESHEFLMMYLIEKLNAAYIRIEEEVKERGQSKHPATDTASVVEGTMPFADQEDEDLVAMLAGVDLSGFDTFDTDDATTSP